MRIFLAICLYITITMKEHLNKRLHKEKEGDKMDISRKEVHLEKIFRGRRYNTESAQKVGAVGPIGLYKKRTGEFFLADTATEEIKPIIYEDALRFARENLKGYEQYFGGSKAKTVTSFSITEETVERLKRLASRKGYTLSQALEEIIRDTYTSTFG